MQVFHPCSFLKFFPITRVKSQRIMRRSRKITYGILHIFFILMSLYSTLVRLHVANSLAIMLCRNGKNRQTVKESMWNLGNLGFRSGMSRVIYELDEMKLVNSGDCVSVRLLASIWGVWGMKCCQADQQRETWNRKTAQSNPRSYCSNGYRLKVIRWPLGRNLPRALTSCIPYESSKERWSKTASSAGLLLRSSKCVSWWGFCIRQLWCIRNTIRL